MDVLCSLGDVSEDRMKATQVLNTRQGEYGGLMGLYCIGRPASGYWMDKEQESVHVCRIQSRYRLTAAIPKVIPSHTV